MVAYLRAGESRNAVHHLSRRNREPPRPVE